jgi:hypothetical protein
LEKPFGSEIREGQMRKLHAFATVALLLAAGVSHAVDRAEFDAIVAFDESLKSLALSVRETGEPPVGERVVVLDGVVASVEVLSSEEGEFRARVELVRGEWRGLEQIVLYKAYVDLTGPRFRGRIATGRRDGSSPDQIRTDEPALVVGRVSDVIPDADGTPVPVIEGFYLRPLQ